MRKLAVMAPASKRGRGHWLTPLAIGAQFAFRLGVLALALTLARPAAAQDAEAPQAPDTSASTEVPPPPAPPPQSSAPIHYENAIRVASFGVAFDTPRRGSLNRIFLSGPTPGSPGAAKTTVVFSLYGLAVVGLSASTYFLLEHLRDVNQTEAFLIDHQRPGPCADFLSPNCQRLQDLQERERNSKNLAALAFAAGGSMLLSGVLTANLWGNVQTSLTPTQSGATVHVRLEL